jgi:hypothetical protein
VWYEEVRSWAQPLTSEARMLQASTCYIEYIVRVDEGNRKKTKYAQLGTDRPDSKSIDVKF